MMNITQPHVARQDLILFVQVNNLHQPGHHDADAAADDDHGDDVDDDDDDASRSTICISLGIIASMSIYCFVLVWLRACLLTSGLLIINVDINISLCIGIQDQHHQYTMQLSSLCKLGIAIRKKTYETEKSS